MKVVKKVTENQPESSQKEFALELRDGSSSPFTLIKDEGEWVLQGDSEQRFSQSELRAILLKIDTLNGKKKTKHR
jgi:hypothetical protein